MNKAIQIFVVFLLSISAGAQSLTEVQEAAITSYLSDLSQELEPGFAVGVVSKGEIIFEYYRGLANMSHQTPIDVNSQFNIASVAKQFTALCVASLVESETIDLKEDFRNYLPEALPLVKQKITVEQLLNHTSGIRDFYDLLNLQGDPWWKKVGYDNQDAIQLLSKQKGLNFTPGTYYLYSNSNYTLLTALIENVSGQSFHVFADSLFSQFGLHATHFQKNYMYVIPNQALPYADWGDGIWQQYPMLTNLYGDGFLYTTLKDQLAWEVLWQQAKSPYQSLFQRMQYPTSAEAFQDYGYGVELVDRQGRKAIHHSGGTGAYHAQMVRYPTDSVSIFVMSNNSRLWSGFIADRLSNILLPERPSISSATAEANQELDYNILGHYVDTLGDLIQLDTMRGEWTWISGQQKRKLTRLAKDTMGLAAGSDAKIIIGNGGFEYFPTMGFPRRYRKLPSFSADKNYFHRLTGTYWNSELDIHMELTTDSNESLVLSIPERDISQTLHLLHRDQFLLYDYIIRANRNQANQVISLQVDFARVKNLTFEKVSDKESLLLTYLSDGGYIQLGTTKESVGSGKGDFLLTRNDADGNEIWFRIIGGGSYEKASAILPAKAGGYLLLGSTSSYGDGNYDVWLVKTDDQGEVEWSKTFGGFGNEYGSALMETPDGILIQAKRQICPNDFKECEWEDWVITLDSQGQLIE